MMASKAMPKSTRPTPAPVCGPATSSDLTPARPAAYLAFKGSDRASSDKERFVGDRMGRPPLCMVIDAGSPTSTPCCTAVRTDSSGDSCRSATWGRLPEPPEGGQNAHDGAQTAPVADFRAWRYDTNYPTMTASTTRRRQRERHSMPPLTTRHDQDYTVHPPDACMWINHKTKSHCCQ